MSKILVTNGNIGMTAAIFLAKKDHTVKVMARKAENNPELEKSGISFFLADACNPAALEKAFEGVDAYLFVSPLVENMVDLAGNLIDAAKKAGVRHIVRSSANGASVEAPIAMGKLHGQVEQLIKNSGLAYTIVQPATFFQNLLGSAGTIREQKCFFASAGDGRNGMVDVRDIAEVAAASLEDPAKHSGKTYVATGPEAISNADIATELSRQTGDIINYVDLPSEELGKMYKSYGMGDWAVNALLELDTITRLGYVSNVSDDVSKVTGREPISLAQFVRDNLSAFK